MTSYGVDTGGGECEPMSDVSAEDVSTVYPVKVLDELYPPAGVKFAR